MPALVNIKVGSLRGTSGEDDTISCPFSRKKFRKVDLISLTPLMFIQSGSWPVGRKNTAFSGGTLLEEPRRTVQKVCSRSCTWPATLKPVDRAPCRVDSLGNVVF